MTRLPSRILRDSRTPCLPFPLITERLPHQRAGMGVLPFSDRGTVDVYRGHIDTRHLHECHAILHLFLWRRSSPNAALHHWFPNGFFHMKGERPFAVRSVGGEGKRRLSTCVHS